MDEQREREQRQPWRGRGNLRALVEELERQRDTRVDFIADSRSLDIGVQTRNENTELVLKPAENARDQRINEWLVEPQIISNQAMKQVAERLLPSGASHKYTFVDAYRKENAAFCARFLDQRLVEQPQRHLVRCLDGRVRALLSDKYRILDNYDLAFSALKVVQENGGQVIEAALSDSHMRLKFVALDVWDTIEQARHKGEMHTLFGTFGNQQHVRGLDLAPTGDLPGGVDTVYPAATITNSETGHGQYDVQIGIIAGWCSNLAMIEEIAAHIHLGSRQELGIYTERTIELESRAIVAKACDALRAAFTRDRFHKLIALCKHAQSVEITEPSSAVANFVESHDLTDADKDSLLRYFVRDYDQTVYGFAQALSRMSQDERDPDRSAEIESLAGEVIREPALVRVR